MFKDSSAKFYKNNNKKLQKSLMKNIKIYLKKKKKKRQYRCERWKCLLKMKSKN